MMQVEQKRNRQHILIRKLTAEMREVFGTDWRRIDHAAAVLRHATRLLREQDDSVDREVVLAAAVLHDIGIPACERKHGSAAGRFQEQEGPPIARQIMKRCGVAEETVDHVCRIIANHHSARNIDTPEFRIVWDADWLVNFREEYPYADPALSAQLIEKIFKTSVGRKEARRRLLAE